LFWLRLEDVYLANTAYCGKNLQPLQCEEDCLIQIHRSFWTCILIFYFTFVPDTVSVSYLFCIFGASHAFAEWTNPWQNKCSSKQINKV
jgi:hypothetical protein